MKRRLNFRSLMVGGALALVAGPLATSQSASAATVIEGIALSQTEAGLSLRLETSGDAAQMAATAAGKPLGRLAAQEDDRIALPERRAAGRERQPGAVAGQHLRVVQPRG